MSDLKSTCRVERLPPANALEFAAYAWPSSDLSEPAWPSAPGAVRCDAWQRPVLLHFAPGRWLAPAPEPEIRSLLELGAQAAAGVIIDVTGKYDRLSVSGAGAARLLACAIDIEAVLESRTCAALTMFDCPAILARAPEGFNLWLQSSYTADFLSTAGRFQASLESSV